MAHLVYGAVSVAVATAIMYTTSLSSLGSQLAKAGIDMPAADQKAINGGTLTTRTAQAIMGKLDADQAETVKSAIATAFDTGMNMAFVFATLSVSMGIILALLLDEKKLHKVES